MSDSDSENPTGPSRRPASPEEEAFLLRQFQDPRVMRVNEMLGRFGMRLHQTWQSDGSWYAGLSMSDPLDGYDETQFAAGISVDSRGFFLDSLVRLTDAVLAELDSRERS